MISLSTPNNWESAERARHAFERYFPNVVVELGEKLNLQGLSKLPLEILQHILQFSWPCTLHPVVIAMAESPDLQSPIFLRETLSRQFILSGNKLYVRRITRAGVSYVLDISYETAPELVWEGGPITEIVITSDGIGIVDINMKGYTTTAIDRKQRCGQWYKSIVALPDQHLDQITVQSKV
jgi:hypothetical protein